MAETDDFTKKFNMLRAPFSKAEIEKRPIYIGEKGKEKKQRCDECGGYHGFPCIHLDYVGHAGITDRLNSVDPKWNWEPLAFDANGLPAYDKNGGMWIKLTILGVTRLAYGDAQGKIGPNAVKEIIGDAIRNGAMRFGVGTYLWSKSEKAEHMKEFEAPESQSKATEQSFKASTPTQQESPRSQAYTRIADKKEWLVSHGTKREGIEEWYKATFGDRGMNKLADTEILQLEMYLDELIKDKESHEY